MSGFFKGSVGIGGQNFSPLVAVITRGIAACKDVAEGVCPAVEGRGLNDGNFGPDFFQNGHQCFCGLVFTVQQHVKQSQLNLPQRLQAALEVFGSYHFVKQFTRQGHACCDMRGHVLQYRPLPAKVFHELAGQLNGIPFHTTDTRHIALIHLCEHVMQAMSKFMEQRNDIVVRQQGGVAIDTFCKVADQVGHWGLQLPVVWS